MSARSLALILATAAAMAPSAALAAPPAAWRTHRVAVLDVRSYARETEDLFVERPATRRLRETAGAWQRRLERLVAERDQVQLVTSATVRERLLSRRNDRESVRLGSTYYALGVERYTELKGGEALAHFDRAIKLYADGLAEVAQPRRVADAHFYRGLALIEAGLPNRARLAFREVLLLDPDRTFQKGYYPPATEAALEGALLDLQVSKEKARLLLPSARMSRLADRIGVDGVVALAIEGTPEAPVLQLTLYDRTSRGIVLSERVPLDSVPAAEARLDRALSAWHACAVRTEERPRFARPRRPQTYIDLGYAHTVLLDHRTRAAFHSPGAAIGLTWEATENLHIFGRLLPTANLQDANGDLLDQFVSTRLIVGAGFTAGTDDFRGYVGAGLELAVAFADIDMTTDVDCKHFGADHPRCSGIFTLAAPGLWFGLNINAGIRWAFVRSFYLHVGAAITLYAVDSDLVKELNFPLSGSIGVGHRF